MLTPDPGVVEALEHGPIIRDDFRGVSTVRHMAEITEDTCPYTILPEEDENGEWTERYLPDSHCECYGNFPTHMASLADDWTDDDEKQWISTGHLRQNDRVRERVRWHHENAVRRFLERQEKGVA